MCMKNIQVRFGLLFVLRDREIIVCCMFKKRKCSQA